MENQMDLFGNAEVGSEILNLQEELASKYKYRPLSPEMSEVYRDRYRETIPKELKINGDNISLYSPNGTLLCNSYDRIVIGDYGAFIETSPENMLINHLCVKEGQEYRINDERYSKNVKYHWYTVPDGSDIKVYFQIRTVSYADYKEGKYYISPFQVKTKNSSDKAFIKILQQNTYCYITVDDYAEGIAEVISVSPENATVEVRWKLFCPCYSCQKVPHDIYETTDIIPFELLHNEGKTIKGVDKEVKEGKCHGIKI